MCAAHLWHEVPVDPSDTTKSFIKHEIGHCFGNYHKHGLYATNSNIDIYDISPMATGYTRTTGTNTGQQYHDTHWAGSGNTPGVDNNEQFCGRLDNNKYNDFCGDVRNRCRHDYSSNNLSVCAVNNFESNAPLTDKI